MTAPRNENNLGEVLKLINELFTKHDQPPITEEDIKKARRKDTRAYYMDACGFLYKRTTAALACSCEECGAKSRIDAVLAAVVGAGIHLLDGKPEMLKEIEDLCDGLIKKYPPPPGMEIAT